MTTAPARPLAMVRNPLLALPAMEHLLLRLNDDAPDLTASEARQYLRAIYRDVARDARARAEHSWKRKKGPMAAYWRAVSVYAGHTARALR